MLNLVRCAEGAVISSRAINRNDHTAVPIIWAELLLDEIAEKSGVAEETGRTPSSSSRYIRSILAVQRSSSASWAVFTAPARVANRVGHCHTTGTIETGRAKACRVPPTNAAAIKPSWAAATLRLTGKATHITVRTLWAPNRSRHSCRTVEPWRALIPSDPIHRICYVCAANAIVAGAAINQISRHTGHGTHLTGRA